MTPVMRNRFVLALQCLSIAALSGCKTDALFRMGSEPLGPVIAWPDGELVADPEAREVDIVEALVAHRDDYHLALSVLDRFYAQHHDDAKRQMVEDERERLQGVLDFRYMLEAQIPPASLRPSRKIAEADRMYVRAYAMLRRGGFRVPALYRQETMIRALKMFQAVIEQYPTSDKIDDAAFYCGEIHRAYLPDQALIAVRWYERAWQWEPKTPHPARFRAARVYEERLQDRAAALELYHAVTKYETSYAPNVRFASYRIRELTQVEGPDRAGLTGLRP